MKKLKHILIGICLFTTIQCEFLGLENETEDTRFLRLEISKDGITEIVTPYKNMGDFKYVPSIFGFTDTHLLVFFEGGLYAEDRETGDILDFSIPKGFEYSSHNMFVRETRSFLGGYVSGERNIVDSLSITRFTISNGEIEWTTPIHFVQKINKQKQRVSHLGARLIAPTYDVLSVRKMTYSQIFDESENLVGVHPFFEEWLVYNISNQDTSLFAKIPFSSPNSTEDAYPLYHSKERNQLLLNIKDNKLANYSTETGAILELCCDDSEYSKYTTSIGDEWAVWTKFVVTSTYGEFGQNFKLILNWNTNEHRLVPIDEFVPDGNPFQFRFSPRKNYIRDGNMISHMQAYRDERTWYVWSQNLRTLQIDSSSFQLPLGFYNMGDMVQIHDNGVVYAFK